MEVVSATFDDAAEPSAIEKAVFGYPRHADYAWLFEQREAYLLEHAPFAIEKIAGKLVGRRSPRAQLRYGH